jgi:hypothetical protein
MNTRYHKAGNTWNAMTYTDRANWLLSVGQYPAWQTESWWHLPTSIRSAFIAHLTQ